MGIGHSLRGILPSVVIDGVLPFLTYALVTTYVPHLSQVKALGLSAVFPVVNGIDTLVRRRQIDIIGAIVLIGIVVTIGAAFLGSDAKLMLIRESFVTGALGVVCLTSFAWRRPLLFYIGRQFTCGSDQDKIVEFNALWERAGARRTFRVMTLVWAVGWLSEFGLRVVMVQRLSVAEVLVLSPIVFNAITLGLIVWTVAYARRRQQRGGRISR